MVNVNNLIFDYPEIRALNNVTIALEKSTITALVGPNGAGKTTLLRCIAGLEKPFSGTIMVDGIDVVSEPRKCHQIVGFLPDFFGLYDGLTVRQSLKFFAAAGGVKEENIDKAVDEAAQRLWIADRLDTQVKTLSRGMRQRLAIAQIVVKKPKVLLLDEPASGLDPGARNELSALFRQLKSEGMTLIVSSHILTELEQYADRLMIMNNGRLLQDDNSDKPETQHTKVFVGVLSDLQQFREFAESKQLVTKTEKDNQNVVLDIAGGPQECAEILRESINNGCRIFEYRIITKDMQSEYLKAVAMCKGGQND